MNSGQAQDYLLAQHTIDMLTSTDVTFNRPCAGLFFLAVVLFLRRYKGRHLETGEQVARLALNLLLHLLKQLLALLHIRTHHVLHGRRLEADELRPKVVVHCRVVAIQGFLSDHDYELLTAATTYCVNFSHGEGQCLPLMESLSFGIPAVTPRHTGMVDYIDESVAFVAHSTLEPTRWPHDDIRNAYRTKRYRLDWESMVNALRESYRVAKEDPEKYSAMSKAAVIRLKQHCSRAVVQEQLRDFITAKKRVFRSFSAK